MKNSNSLRNRLLLFSIVVVMVPMVILYLIILAFFNMRSARENERYAYYNMQTISDTLDSALSGLNELSLYLIVNTPVRGYLQSADTRQDNSSEQYRQANTALQFLPFSSKYYSMVTVFSHGNGKLSAGKLKEESLSATERERADQLTGGSFWSITDEGVALVRTVRDVNRLSQSLGYIKVNLNQQALEDLLRIPDTLPDTTYFILTQDGVMLQNGDIPGGVLAADTLQFENIRYTDYDNFTLKADGQVYKISSRAIQRGKAAVVSLLNQNSLYRLDGLLFSSILVAGILSAFFVTLLASYYTKWVLSPLRRLGDIMKNTGETNIPDRFEVQGNNEIAVLAGQFNLMREKLRVLHEQVYVDMLKLKDAEIAILQSEINPHFLYNTLDTIYWMSEVNHTWQISEMVHSLSKLFRISLQKFEGGLAPLRLECEHMSCYLAIQRVRYQDSIAFEFYVQEGIEDVKVLKLLLQPIVENAIIHGAEPAGGGRVVINIYREDDTIIYNVFNTGTGVDMDYIDRMLRNECASDVGFAIRNVNDRIRLKFGEEFGISFENQLEGGVLVTVRQPAERKKQ